jgi:hypothetical protein
MNFKLNAYNFGLAFCRRSFPVFALFYFKGAKWSQAADCILLANQHGFSVPLFRVFLASPLCHGTYHAWYFIMRCLFQTECEFRRTRYGPDFTFSRRQAQTC